MKRKANSSRRRTQPKNILEQYAKFLDDTTGIFASNHEYDLPWEGSFHVYAGQLKPEFCTAPRTARRAISSTVCGAGITAVEAKLSCVLEALERHSGIFRGDEPQRMARYSEIVEDAIHPDALTLFSESQYRERESWNQHEGGYNWVPQRFDEERSIAWSPAWSLTEQRMKYLPVAYCYFGYPFDPVHDFCRPDSNGNAAGDTRDDAIVHGFLELVERECVSVWWYNLVRRPRVEFDGFALPHLASIRSAFAAIGRSADVLDITLHQSVPAFAAISRSEHPHRDDYIFGFGAHFDARVALTRALTEMTQLLPAVLADRNPSCFLRADNAPSDMSFLAPDKPVAAITASSFRQPDKSARRYDVSLCIALAKDCGLEMLVLDQTREDIALPVVKVVVPGMRSWWARFAPGRLYTLPVTGGWLTQHWTEAELNPCHLIL